MRMETLCGYVTSYSNIAYFISTCRVNNLGQCDDDTSIASLPAHGTTQLSKTQ